MNIIQKLQYNTIVFEQLLKINKTQLYHELILVKNARKTKVLNTLKGKALREALKVINLDLNNCQKVLKRAEKYNNEVTNSFIGEVNKESINMFIEESQDFYSDITDLLIHHTGEGNVKVLPCLMIEDKKGTLFHNGKTYSLKTK